MSGQTLRRRYVNEGWTEEGLKRKKEAMTAHVCAGCGGQLPKFARLWCSPECYSDFYEKYHGKVFDWAKVRKGVLERDNQKCVKCGSTAYEVDHIIEVAEGGAEFDEQNCQSLCHDCHAKKTADYLRKKLSKPRQHPQFFRYLDTNGAERFFRFTGDQSTL